MQREVCDSCYDDAVRITKKGGKIPMIKGEIRTDAATYDLDLNQFDDVEAAYDYVKEILEGDRVFRSDSGILELGDAAQLKHIRVYRATPYVPPFMQDQAEGPADDAIVDPNKPRFYEVVLDRAKYLGNTINMKCQAFTKNGHTWYLPMEINGQPAYDVLGAKNMEEFIDYWNMSKGTADDRYTVIVPPQQLPDYEEAREYIKDFIAEVEADQEYEPKAPNAKAWQGWKGEGTE